jgi:hypothetical protein
MAIFALDLTQRAPRSPRVRLGGYAILARALDKGRATIVKKNGEYHYNCPLDQSCFEFIGITGEALKKELAKGASDSDVLAWIEKHGKHKRLPFQIEAWSAFAEKRAPSDIGSREYYNGLVKQCGPKREDIATWFEMLDVDDYVTFGGQS